MKVWGRKAEPPAVIGVAQAANEGLSRQELLQKALHTLANDGRADRIGAWLESPGAEDMENQGIASFRGMVWDRENGNMPAEWRRLSPEAPLPQDMLTSGRSVEQELEGGALPMIGPLLELRRALWAPIERRGHLRGVLLAGSRSRHGDLPRELLETTAAELALAIELEEEQQLSRERQADLGLSRQILTSLGTTERPGLILSDLVDDCTSKTKHGNGLGVIFVVIGSIPEDHGNSAPQQIAFHWTSGDAAWTNAVENHPTSEVWRRAVKTRRLTGEEPDAQLTRHKVARIVAIPLEANGSSIGVLVAGLAPDAASLAIVQRLELRAALAALALGAWKRNQEEMREAAWRKALLDSSPEATILLDSAGRIAAANASARMLLSEQPGRENARVQTGGVGQRLAQLFQAADQQRMEAWSGWALSGIGERRVESRNETPELPDAVLSNGTRVRLRPAMPAGGPYAAVVLHTWRDSDSTPGGSRAEIELHSVLEWLEEGVLLFDAQENVRAINTRFLQIAGLSAADTADLATLDRLIFRLSDRVAEPWNFAQRWRNLARGIDGGIREELEWLRPAQRIVQRMARPILDANGRRLGRVEIYRDLTARRGFQSKLLHTEKLAALGQLITGVVHELNNPLTSILGYSQRLLQKEQTAGNGREIRQIFQEAERAAAILRQLLLNAHESKPELRTVALNQVVLQAIELQQVSLTEENIRVEMDLDPGWPLVQGDAGQLQQVLMNLTGNARQALDQTGKGGTIRVRTKQIGDQRVLLEIADDGPGIPQEILGRIFDPFFTTKPAGIGTGLGLAIVLGIVREHGGHVNVASPPNGGAIFSIALRAASSSSRDSSAARETTGKLHGYSAYPGGKEASEVKPTAAAMSSGSVAFQGISRKESNRILVVEDEPTVARLIADVLEEEGFHVDVLLDGHEALEQVARETYDLVICDMKMPGLDGQQFYKALVRTGNLLSERFLFVTGDVVSLHTHEFLERHRLPHVAKPFRMEELKNRVRELLDRSFPREPRAARQGRMDEVRPT